MKFYWLLQTGIGTITGALNNLLFLHPRTRQFGVDATFSLNRVEEK